MISCEPEDWKEKPSSFEKILDPDLKQFAYDLNAVWKTLCRQVESFPNKNQNQIYINKTKFALKTFGFQIKEEVKTDPDRFSLLYVPNEFIIPGGRFREFYYWDAYWIVKVS